MNQLQTLELLTAGFSVIIAIVLEVIYRVVKTALDRGKPILITLPGTPGALAKVDRRHLDEGQKTDAKGDEGKSYVAAGPASYPSNWGPIHFLTDYGVNLVAPSKEDVAEAIIKNDGGASLELKALLEKHKGKTSIPEDAAERKDFLERQVLRAKILANRFLVWDPLLLYRSNRENDMEDLYSSALPKEHWMVKLAPIFIVFSIVLMAGMSFLIYKVLPLLAHSR